MIGIYQILNTVNNKSYIGSSVQIETRLAKHIRQLNRGKHENSYLQRSFDKYGVEAFQFKPIIECELSSLQFYEDLIIKNYRSNTSDFGFNLREVSSSNAGMKILNRHKDLPGTVHNSLTLIKELGVNKYRKILWLCSCVCGNQTEVSIAYVRSGHTKSCGCLIKEKTREIGKRNKKAN